MPARPYRASGQSNPGGVLRLALVCLAAALVAGVIEGFVSRWISLLIIFPLGLGLAVGAAATAAIEGAHVRAPRLAILVAGLMGLVSQMAVHVTQYVDFRQKVRAEIAEARALPGAEGGAMDGNAVLDMVLMQKTGHAGFAGYLHLRAQSGTEIKKVGHSSNSGLKLEGTGFWVFFGINFLIVAGVAAGMAASRAGEPYCEACHRWYDRLVPLAVGSGDKSAVTATRQALDRGAYAEVPGALGVPRKGSASVLQLRGCSTCAGHEPLLIYQTLNGAERNQKAVTAFQTLLHPDESRRLHEALPPPEPAPAT